MGTAHAVSPVTRHGHAYFHPDFEETTAMHTAPRQVHVRVPATTANLGSGFDILGLALQLYNVFMLTTTSAPGWRVSVPPGVQLPTDDQNLVFQAARALFTHVGVTPPGL